MHRTRDGDSSAVTEVAALWRGRPYEGFQWFDEVQEQRVRLEALRAEMQRLVDEAAAPTLPTPTRTKFLRREVGSGSFIARPRLLERLGAVGDTPVLVVTAPAGFGKSVLLSQWAAAQSARVAWLTLDAGDNDPVRFWSAVVHAFGECGILDVDAVPDEAVPGSQAFIEALAGLLAASSEPVGLVLDDLHRVTDPVLLDQFAATLRCLPATCTVAMAARPPLSSALRARLPDGVPCLDATDLRFASDEVVEVARGADAGVDGAVLLSHTHGWPIAVTQLSRTRGNLSRLAASSMLHDYVLEELHRFVPEDVGAFLLSTALLDSFTADLAAAVSGSDEVDRHLDWLTRHGLFLLEMEAGSGWYHYHELVGEVLRQVARETPGIDVPAGHRRAARWYRDRDLAEDALRHAVAGEDHEVVAQVAGQVLLSAISHNEIRTCRHWLETMDPTGLVTNRAAHDLATLTAGGWLDRASCGAWVRSRRGYGSDDLLPRMIEGHVAYLEGRAGACVAINDECLDRLDAYFDTHPSLPGVRALAEATLRSSSMGARILAGEFHHDDPELVEFAKRSRAEPLLSVWVYGEWAFLALVEGNNALAAELVAEVVGHLGSMDELSRSLGAGRLLVAQSLVESERSGEPVTQRRIVRRLEPLVTEYRRLGWDVELVPVLLALQVAHQRLGDLEAAQACAQEVEVLLELCEDAPLLVAARYRLDMGLTVGEYLAQARPEPDLTPRETSVMSQLRSSRSYDEIAARLGVSRHTVAEHVKAIYRKLGVRSRYGAVRRHRVLSPTH